MWASAQRTRVDRVWGIWSVSLCRGSCRDARAFYFISRLKSSVCSAPAIRTRDPAGCLISGPPSSETRHFRASRWNNFFIRNPWGHVCTGSKVSVFWCCSRRVGEPQSHAETSIAHFKSEYISNLSVAHAASRSIMDILTQQSCTRL